MLKLSASHLVKGILPPFESVYNANTLYLCVSIALIFWVDLLSGQGSLSLCLSGSCNLFLWESDQLVGSTIVRYEPGSVLGRTGYLWLLRHAWHVSSARVSLALTLARLAAGWLLAAPGSAGWGKSHTRRFFAGCTLCLSRTTTCGVCWWPLLCTTAGTSLVPYSWRNRACFCGCWMCTRLSRQSATELYLMLAHKINFSAHGSESKAGNTLGSLVLWESDWLVDMPVSKAIDYQPIQLTRLVLQLLLLK